jgi:hypothetical protein
VVGLLILATTACTPLLGGAVLLGLVTVGALASSCYDYLDVTVLDADGHRTCAATVTASSGKSQFELTSCYYAPLTDGRWKLRASLPGFSDALSTVDVDHAHDCTRHVQTVELTLHRPGTGSGPTSAPLPPAAPTPMQTPVPALPTASAPPAAEPAAPASAPPPNPPPTGSAAPSVDMFPDRSEAPR